MAEIAEALLKVNATLESIYSVLVMIFVVLALMLLCKDMGHGVMDQIRRLRSEAERRNRR